ncbi:hypothetical protein GCM10010466_58490 [Planomonospora alba]|uniref:Uncharacterized protein n=1 Tax=Planomonospora alba TaxID=161354 RepID=A0ABP6NW17_9ACTN
MVGSSKIYRTFRAGGGVSGLTCGRRGWDGRTPCSFGRSPGWSMAIARCDADGRGATWTAKARGVHRTPVEVETAGVACHGVCLLARNGLMVAASPFGGAVGQVLAAETCSLGQGAG